MERKISIIVADDDIDDQFLVKQAIAETEIKYEVASVYNGLQLMDYLLRREVYANLTDALPDLILLDINTPIVTGFGVLTQLREHSRLKDIPVYMLTTSRLEVDRKKALELGAKGFYTKPVHFFQLKTIINEVTSRTFEFNAG